MFRLVAIVSIACAPCACSRLAPAPAAEPEVVLLASVNTANGVSREEAENIAQAYFLRHVGCGAYAGVSEAGDNWVVDGVFGYAAQPIKGLFISKQSGAITSPVGPSYARPMDMLE